MASVGWLSAADHSYGCELMNYSDFWTPQNSIKLKEVKSEHVDIQACHDPKKNNIQNSNETESKS